MIWGAGPTCRLGRPARFLFVEGPRGPLGSGRGAPGGAPQKKKSGRPARPAWRAGPPYHILYRVWGIVGVHFMHCVGSGWTAIVFQRSLVEGNESLTGLW